MTTPDYRALCEELLNELSAYKMANPMHDWYLLNRARVALAEPEPPAYREVAGLVAWLRCHASAKLRIQREQFLRAADLLERLAPQPEPEGPSDEELWQIGDPEFQSNTWPTDAIKYARAVLARWGRP